MFSRKFADEGNRLKEVLGIAPDTLLFGFLGRFMPQKGFGYLIDATAELETLEACHGKFKIIAVSDGDYIKRYKRMVKEKNLSDVILFYGFVPNVSTIIQDLDAIVMPSLWEAYSLLPIEALVMGCPVMATDCIGLREVVKNTPALIARNRDAASLAETMMQYMKDPGAVRRKTVDFIPTARERYSITRTARQLDQLFEKVS